jgi:Uma2 family endonuclease
MPTVVTEIPARPAPPEPPRKKWTRTEWAAIESLGLWNQEHLELIEGELISKMGKKRPHVITTTVVHPWFVRVFGAEYVNLEAPIDVAPEDNPTNEPEPDLIVLSRPSHEIRDANPRPEDLRLVVEISDSTVAFDMTTKAPLYARAGIVEYWVFDIPARRIIVHRDPREGHYESVTAYSEQERVSPLAAPGQEFFVKDAFPA